VTLMPIAGRLKNEARYLIVAAGTPEVNSTAVFGTSAFCYGFG
jgi:hypothetical protein